MVKSIISAIVGFVILIASSIIEFSAINNTFNDFNQQLKILEQKTQNEIAVESDAEKVYEFWVEQKRTLHILIPHNEIKEIDLWLLECQSLIQTEMYEDALSKIQVVLGLVEQIPKTFSLRIENVM